MSAAHGLRAALGFVPSLRWSTFQVAVRDGRLCASVGVTEFTGPNITGLTTAQQTEALVGFVRRIEIESGMLSLMADDPCDDWVAA